MSLKKKLDLEEGIFARTRRKQQAGRQERLDERRAAETKGREKKSEMEGNQIVEFMKAMAVQHQETIKAMAAERREERREERKQREEIEQRRQQAEQKAEERRERDRMETEKRRQQAEQQAEQRRQDERRQDQQRQDELRQQDRDHQNHWKERQMEERRVQKPSMKISPYRDGEDELTFLEVFEQTLKLHGVPEDDWHLHWSDAMGGKIRTACKTIDLTVATYPEIKLAVLAYCGVTPENQRIRLRELKWTKQTSPEQYAQQTENLMNGWMSGKDDRDQMIAAFVVEAMIAGLPEEMSRWIQEREPKHKTEVTTLMQKYLTYHPEVKKEPRSGSTYGRQPWKESLRKPVGEKKPFERRPFNREGRPTPTKQEMENITCYKCAKKGHYARDCRQGVFAVDEKKEVLDQFICRGNVNKGPLVELRVDSACSRTIVRRDLIPDVLLRPGRAELTVANGTLLKYGLADVILTVGKKDYSLEVAVTEDLPVPVLLGVDLPLLTICLPKATKEQLKEALREKEEEEARELVAMVTRSQAKTQAEAEEKLKQTTEEWENISKDSSNSEDQQVEKPTLNEDETGAVFEFEDELFLPAKDPQSSHTRLPEGVDGLVTCDVQNPQRKKTFRQTQETDEEVQRWMREENPSRVVQKEGILLRKWRRRDLKEPEVLQLVLPKEYRTPVLKLAHSVPISGHLGREKTMQRILARFYWPTVQKDVRQYCKECPQCQLSSKRKGPRVPLMPLPIMGEPFSRMAMDIVGPLPKTRHGCQYILVICDYATRYPEAFPLKNITAQTVAVKLVELFSRHGIPREILTDQGTNFTSALLTELYQMLGVRPIRTTPYHPQTDGLVERFNQTLKQMLRKVIAEDGRDWDEMLPYVLYAFREVPQASTGFTPFELLYGRDVRGPLDVIKGGWTKENEEENDILTYVQRVYDRLESAKDIVHDNMRRSQVRQKEWYDKKARELKLEAGDEVLVLLPDHSEKLLAKWKGPFKVTRRLGAVNYEVEITTPQHRLKIFHINMLKKWHEPEAGPESEEVYCVMDEQEELPCLDRNNQEMSEAIFGEDLTVQQRKQMESVIQRHNAVIRQAPGRTDLVTHRIPTNDLPAIRQRPYRMSAEKKKEVVAELNSLLESGVVEPSSSDWASPIVVVGKKDGSNRICIDYRKLNAQARFDAYPMPRIDDMLDAIGQAHYLTTIDLAKGYWQVPMAKEDKPKTAFTSPLGLLQFTVMPFGLSGAPATFQRLMDNILRGTEEFAAVYLDDIVIHSSTWEEHIEQVGEILKRLQGAGLTIKLKKCSFGVAECAYLGHQIGRGGVKPAEGKIEAVQGMRAPRTKKEVRSFNGLVNYYRRFIPHYATIAEPLTNLTKKNMPDKVEWTLKLEESFQQCKKELTNAVMLRNPDYSQTFQLQTDASDVGVGAVLSQGGLNDQPVAYFSKKLLDREKNYSTVEKECLAIMLGVKAFAIYLLGKPFVLQTDNRALVWLKTLKDKNSRLTRWSLALQPYTFMVEHRKGTANANADALSRLPMQREEEPCFAQEKRGKSVTGRTNCPSQVSPSNRKSVEEPDLADHSKTGPPRKEEIP